MIDEAAGVPITEVKTKDNGNGKKKAKGIKKFT